MKSRVTAFFLLSCAALYACSGSGSGDAGDVSSDSAGDVADVADEAPDACRPEEAELVTLLSQYEVFAGETVTVKCAFEGCDDWTPEGMDFLVAGEKGEDYYLEKHSVTFEKPGKYEVACTFEGQNGELQDVTPAEIVVLPGVPDEIVTSVSVDEVKAGTKVSVDCSAFDEFDNQIYGQFIVAVVPQTGVSIAGTTFTPTIVGEYEVVCVLDGLHAGEYPASLDVVPNVPAKVYTELTEDVVTAGDSAGLTCRATDLWENKVAGFPMVVAVPTQVELTGLTIVAWIVGDYEVKCVPQALDWGLFSLYPAMLHVVPATPAGIELEVVPHKQTYKVLDKIVLQVSVVDEFGNLVPDAELLPVSVEPAEGVVELQPWNFKFTEINQYLFVVKFAGPPLLQADTVVVVDGVGPLLSVDYPERGATVDGAAQVSVTGTVSDQVSGLE